MEKSLRVEPTCLMDKPEFGDRLFELEFFDAGELEFGEGILKLLVEVIPKHHTLLSRRCPARVVLEEVGEGCLDAGDVY
jgi:hypothetical protein